MMQAMDLEIAEGGIGCHLEVVGIGDRFLFVLFENRAEENSPT
jgi:hypothetical protein